MSKTKKHKWLVTLEQLKRQFGDDLEAIIANAAANYNIPREQVIGYLGEYRDLPIKDEDKGDAVRNSAKIKRMHEIDADFAAILKDGPDSVWLQEVREWFGRLVKNENA